MNSLRVRFSLYFLLSRFWLHTSIWVIFFLSKGFTLTELAVINSSMWISVVLFEVPTGYVADKYGRKVSLMSSYIVEAIGILLFVIGTSAFTLVFSGIVWGIGITLRSGAGSAWIYDEMKTQFRHFYPTKDEFNMIYFRWTASFRVIGLMSMALAQFVGGLLADIQLWLPHTIMIIINLSVFFLLATIPEHSRPIFAQTSKIHNSSTQPWYRIVKVELSSRQVLSGSVLAIIIWSFMDIRYFMQLDFQNSGISLELIGLFFTGVMFASSMGSMVSVYLASKLKSKLFLSIFLSIGLFFVVMSQSFVYVVMICYLLISFLDGVFQPSLDVFLNDKISSKYRATTLSLLGVGNKVIYILFSVAAGITVDNFSFNLLYLWVGGVFLVIGLVFGRSLNNTRQGNEETWDD